MAPWMKYWLWQHADPSSDFQNSCEKLAMVVNGSNPNVGLEGEKNTPEPIDQPVKSVRP